MSIVFALSLVNDTEVLHASFPKYLIYQDNLDEILDMHIKQMFYALVDALKQKEIKAQ